MQYEVGQGQKTWKAAYLDLTALYKLQPPANSK
jgi:hypothetical protein